MQGRKGTFLQALARGNSVAAAAETASVTRSTVYRWRHQDKAFAKEWADALEASADLLEDEARRRAVEGVEEVVYYGGKPVGVVRKYSDSLLTLLLKARRPEFFGDHKKVGGSIEVTAPEALSVRERQSRLEALLRLAGQRQEFSSSSATGEAPRKKSEKDGGEAL